MFFDSARKDSKPSHIGVLCVRVVGHIENCSYLRIELFELLFYAILEGQLDRTAALATATKIEHYLFVFSDLYEIYKAAMGG